MMSSKAGSMIEGPPVAVPARRNILPFAPESRPDGQKISDATQLRIANALQSSLHTKDVIKGFAQEIRRIVRGVSVRYRYRNEKILLQDGPLALHQYSYELNLVGKHLGAITFSRHKPLSENDQELLEILLCALIYPFRNSLLYERALKIALKDPLTGVSNRASMGAHLQHHMSLADRQATPLSLLMIDIDRFKSINDEYGHIVGDVVLTHIARRIVACTRTSDGVFRYSGEEFVVVLPNTKSEGAELLAEHIRKEIEMSPVNTTDVDMKVTVSIGVALHQPGDSDVQFIQRADEVLYEAKDGGRNLVVVADVSGIRPLASGD